MKGESGSFLFLFFFFRARQGILLLFKDLKVAVLSFFKFFFYKKKIGAFICTF